MKTTTTALILSAFLASVSLADAAPVKTVIFCGFGTMLFCPGMASVASQTGAELRDWSQERAVQSEIIAEHPKAVCLGGFSMGGGAAQRIADNLQSRGIKVNGLAMFDPFGAGRTKIKNVWFRHGVVLDHVALAYTAPAGMVAFLKACQRGRK